MLTSSWPNTQMMAHNTRLGRGAGAGAAWGVGALGRVRCSTAAASTPTGTTGSMAHCQWLASVNAPPKAAHTAGNTSVTTPHSPCAEAWWALGTRATSAP